MNPIYEKLESCYKSVREKTDFVPKVAIVLGSGLGDYATEIKVETEVEYKDIEGFPISTVVGHEGKFIMGYVGDVPVICMKGRVHYYEGYPMSDVVLPTRLMHKLGAEYLFLTNASGGIREGFTAGSLMMITDHISTFVPNPLVGPNIEELGVRFPDMSHVYRTELQDVIRSVAKENNIPLAEGIYIQFTGPSYESPAEIRMAKTLGADAVGMSTVVEAITANHCGMKICGVSCISNLAAGISPTPLSHKEVQEAADKVAPMFKKLVTESVKRFGTL
ncbi:MAG: purine-nucleoside phosphorylase [Lachnospiraceae bacterium]|nr:purine-nucleoside phosphorylase [Lachnospiraceae bacterium]